MHPDPFDHPDLRDNAWRKGAERRARRKARKARRRQVAIWGRRPRTRFRHVRTVLVVVLVLGAAGGGIYLIGERRDAQPPGTYADQPAADPIDLTRPFHDTPAQSWAGGADGIVLPRPKPVAGFSAKEVARAQRQVKALLVASRLDRALVERGETGALVRLVAPSQRPVLRREFGGARWPLSFATRTAPGSRLLPAAPKVRGEMRVEAGDEPGQLRVRTNYVFAYAFAIDDPSRARAALDIVAMHRAEVAFVLVRGGQWRESDLGVHVEDAQAFTYSMACGPHRDKGLLAPSYLERLEGLPSGRRPPEYFDHTRPLPRENTCGPAEAG